MTLFTQQPTIFRAWHRILVVKSSYLLRTSSQCLCHTPRCQEPSHVVKNPIKSVLKEVGFWCHSVPGPDFGQASEKGWACREEGVSTSEKAQALAGLTIGTKTWTPFPIALAWTLSTGEEPTGFRSTSQMSSRTSGPTSRISALTIKVGTYNLPWRQEPPTSYTSFVKNSREPSPRRQEPTRNPSLRGCQQLSCRNLKGGVHETNTWRFSSDQEPPKQNWTPSKVSRTHSPGESVFAQDNPLTGRQAPLS